MLRAARLARMHQLVFYLPIVFGAILAVGAALGLLDVGLDADVEMDFDVDVDLDAELDAEVDADAEGDAEGEGEGAGGQVTLLTFLGVGKAPLGVLVMSACFLFGLFGLAIDVTLEHLLSDSAAWVALSAGVAGLVTFVSTGAVGRFFGRLVPSKETYASKKTDLLGLTGVAELATDDRFGLAQVRDAGGAQLKVRVRTLEDERIARGEPLVIADYDEDNDTFLVTRLPS